MRLGARVVAMTFLALSFVPTAWTRLLVPPLPGKALGPEYLLLEDVWVQHPVEARWDEPHHDEGVKGSRLGITTNEDTDPRGCRCVAWGWNCIPNCQPECYPRTELVCTPEGCTEETTCDIVYRCSYDCIPVCLVEFCYI